MKVLAWYAGFFILLYVFIRAAESENYAVAGVAFIIALVVLGPAYFRKKDEAFQAGLGKKPRDDAMRRD
jgi:hypothetical protein